MLATKQRKEYTTQVITRFETEYLKVVNMTGLNGGGVIRKCTIHILSFSNIL